MRTVDDPFPDLSCLDLIRIKHDRSIPVLSSTTEPEWIIWWTLVQAAKGIVNPTDRVRITAIRPLPGSRGRSTAIKAYDLYTTMKYYGVIPDLYQEDHKTASDYASISSQCFHYGSIKPEEIVCTWTPTIQVSTPTIDPEDD